jgi:hypothetical protein
MTAVLGDAGPDRVVRDAKGHPRPIDYVWLTVRQHGGVLVVGAVLTGLLCAGLLVAQSMLAAVHCSGASTLSDTAGRLTNCETVQLQHLTLYGRARWLLRGAAFAPVLLGVFWGAPLVAREYEAGTHTLAWGQELSARQWLRGKVAVLGVAAVLLGIPYGSVLGWSPGRCPG